MGLLVLLFSVASTFFLGWVILRSCLSLISKNSNKTGVKYPPGPIGFPYNVLSFLPFVGKKPFETFTKLGEDYGDVYQFWLANKRVVVLNSQQVIRDSLGKDFSCAGRPNLPSMETILQSGGQARIPLRTASPTWKFLRRSAIKALSLFATSKNSKLEGVVQDAVEDMQREIDTYDQRQAFDPKKIIFKTVAGVMGAVTFSGQYDPVNPLLEKVITFTEKISKFVSVGSALDYLPFGSLLMSWQIHKFKKDIAPLNQFTENAISNHVCNDEICDMADALQKTVSETAIEEKHSLGLSDSQIKAVAQDLFSAGFATTMESFRWALNLLAKFTEKQKKLQIELDQVLEGRKPSLRDREQLPYCEAVLLEVLRFSSVAPFGIPHFTITDTEINGYFVPKDTVIIANLYGHHYNPEVFQNPKDFVPERFLTAEGHLDTDAAQKIMAFSTGKRRCIGENLARQELALLLAATFQHYEVRPGPGVEINPFDCISGLTRIPLVYELLFERRKL